LAVTAIAILLAVGGVYFVLPHLISKTQERARTLLEANFEQVEFQSLEVEFLPFVSFLPGVRCHGRRMQLSLKDSAQYLPFIMLESFSVDVGILGLFQTPVHLQHVKFEGMQIQIPPKSTQKRPKSSDSGRIRKLPNLIFEEIVADGTVLRIIPKETGKQPLEFLLHDLHLRELSPGHPMSFQAVLDNPKPPGRIETNGFFGPMRLDEPGLSAVAGEYTFTNANLAVFGGIAGTLASEGEFTGTLGRIEVSGTTDVPDFRLRAVESPVHLKTSFQAVVDGTSGDTLLQPVEADLEGSKFEMRGEIAGQKGIQGKTVRLDAKSLDAEIRDFLQLAVKAEEPLLTGDLRFNSEILIPPGKTDVLHRLALQGDFDLDSARFHPSVQERIDLLSKTGRGHPNRENDRSSDNTEMILSDFHGEFRLEDGVMDFPSLQFNTPGVEVMLVGRYGLLDEELDFRGELLMDAKLSQMTTGVKSFFLKAVDPLLSRRGAGTVVPIKISGNRKDPDFDVQIGRVFTRKDAVEPQKDLSH